MYTIFILLVIASLSCEEDIEVFLDRSELNEDNHTLPEIISFDIPDSHLIDFEHDTLSFLALGDSYTIGTGVEERYRWPNQLVDKLRDQKIKLIDAKIVAGAGWTTGNLLKVLSTRPLAAKYDLVSLLIGVNNQYQGGLFTTFQKEFVALLKFSLGKTKSRNSLFVLSIPDYGITPFGGNQFGSVFLLFTDCFLEDPGLVFGECRRVMNSSGHLVVALIPGNSKWGQELAGKGRDGHILYRHARFYEKELIEKIKTETREKLIRKYCLNRCPKCGDEIEAVVFREVPMDKCPGCGGVWLGPNDFKMLSEKDHRTWFDRWYKEEAVLEDKPQVVMKK